MEAEGAALSNSWVREPDDSQDHQDQEEGWGGTGKAAAGRGLGGCPALPTEFPAHALQLSPISCPGLDVLSPAFPFYTCSSSIVSSLYTN